MSILFSCRRAGNMKETPRRRRTVTSSLNELSTDQLGNKKRVRREVLSRPPPPLSVAGFWVDI
jgi:hypothetical protein